MNFFKGQMKMKNITSDVDFFLWFVSWFDFKYHAGCGV